MKKIKEILGGVWKIYVFIWFCLLLIILYPLYLIFLLNENYFNKGFNLLLIHTWLLVRVSGIFVQIKNKHYIDKYETYVITPNHSSYLDTVILYQTFRKYFVFMAKHELASIPVFNIFFKKMNITVDRKSATSGKKAMERCAQELDKNHSVVMFPEGTIPEGVPNMLRFKNGAFKLAIEKQVPVIPITFLTNYKRLEMASLFRGKAGPGLAKAIIHKPIPTKGMTQEDLIPLRDKVFNIINTEIQNYAH